MPLTGNPSLDDLRRYWDEQSRQVEDRHKVDFSPRTQRARFEAFLRQHPIEIGRVLDLGCGIGAFYAHLRQRNVDCDYVGFDVSPEMIALCRQRYPEANFVCGDIFDWGESGEFDFSVAFGIHNVKIDSAWEILAAVTRRQFALTRTAAHISLLTARYLGFGDRAQPWSPERVLNLAFELTPYVRLEHDVLPNDFSITLYREPLIDRANDLLLAY